MSAVQKHASDVRLDAAEISTIKKAVEQLDAAAEVYLFGSRADAAKRGGDIDLLIVSANIVRRDLYKIRWAFFERFGEQKIDIVLDDGSGTRPFVRRIFDEAVRL